MYEIFFGPTDSDLTKQQTKPPNTFDESVRRQLEQKTETTKRVKLPLFTDISKA